MARFRGLGRSRATATGEVLFAEGDEGSDFFVVESGSVAIVQGYGRRTGSSPSSVRGQFLGELQHAHRSASLSERGGQRRRRGDPGPRRQLREIVAEDKALSDIILGAFMARRSILIDAETGIKLIGSRFSPDYAPAARVPGAQPHAPPMDRSGGGRERGGACSTELASRPRRDPGRDRRRRRDPAQPDECRRWVGQSASAPRGAPPALCDLVVVGAGPAGLAAAVYAASEGLDTQGSRESPAAARPGTSARIENYLGFPAGVSGSELAQRAGVQAIKFGVAPDCAGHGRPG